MFESSEEILLLISKKIKSERRLKKISQTDLANKSGVSFGSIKRFETSGEISLSSLIKILIALNLMDDVRRLII
jgi:transcriptional regulator with XRE-family HTH domain